ncbi:MAG TPA: HlyD family efflux transporter periplasmic adaptor subunit [Kofleriaceae bacterium]|nr:HlyD family efflux transporter periplasmic adaptor subunit [Kofleriaceae bacterium]
MKGWLLALALVSACGKRDEIQLADVRRDDLVIGVEVTGELAAVDSTDIKPPPLPNVWNFKIASLATEGDEVKTGQPVIGFDASDQIRALEQMQSEADAAQKKLDKKRDDAALARRDDELKIATAEATYRKSQLEATGSPDLVANINLETLKLDEDTARLALEGAKNHAAESKRSDEQEIAKLNEKSAYAKKRVAELQQNIVAMQVMSPRDGTVVLPMNWQGEKHKVGDGVWKMEDIMQVVGLGKMIGQGVVDEVDIARVSVGQTVALRLDALPDVQLSGNVQDLAKNVEPKSFTDPSKIVKLKVAIGATKVPLRPGMRFRGNVEVERRPNAIVVPVECVFVKPDGPVAYRKHGQGFERVKLELGKRSASAIEVVKGLEPGDRVARTEPPA